MRSIKRSLDRPIFKPVSEICLRQLDGQIVFLPEQKEQEMILDTWDELYFWQKYKLKNVLED